MQSMDFDRCLKATGDPDIWMVREGPMSRVLFQNWQDYADAGEPVFEAVSPEELEKYRVAKQFRPLHRKAS